MINDEERIETEKQIGSMIRSIHRRVFEVDSTYMQSVARDLVMIAHSLLRVDHEATAAADLLGKLAKLVPGGSQKEDFSADGRVDKLELFFG